MARRALVVLGGGLWSDGTQPPWVENRGLHAARVWESAAFERVITCGRRPVPHLRSEARALAEALVQRGVPREVILEEEVSKTTVENAFFSRVLHADLLGVRRDVVVVTNTFHAARTRQIFELVYGEAHVQIEAADDSELDPHILGVDQRHTRGGSEEWYAFWWHES